MPGTQTPPPRRAWHVARKQAARTRARHSVRASFGRSRRLAKSGRGCRRPSPTAAIEARRRASACSPQPRPPRMPRPSQRPAREAPREQLGPAVEEELVLILDDPVAHLDLQPERFGLGHRDTSEARAKSRRALRRQKSPHEAMLHVDAQKQAHEPKLSRHARSSQHIPNPVCGPHRARCARICSDVLSARRQHLCKAKAWRHAPWPPALRTKEFGVTSFSKAQDVESRPKGRRHGAILGSKLRARSLRATPLLQACVVKMADMALRRPGGEALRSIEQNRCRHWSH